MFTAIIRQHQALGTPVSAATLTRIRATLRAALNAAIRRGLISDNPAARAELPQSAAAARGGVDAVPGRAVAPVRGAAPGRGVDGVQRQSRARRTWACPCEGLHNGTPACLLQRQLQVVTCICRRLGSGRALAVAVLDAILSQLAPKYPHMCVLVLDANLKTNWPRTCIFVAARTRDTRVHCSWATERGRLPIVDVVKDAATGIGRRSGARRWRVADRSADTSRCRVHLVSRHALWPPMPTLAAVS